MPFVISTSRWRIPSAVTFSCKSSGRLFFDLGTSSYRYATTSAARTFLLIVRALRVVRRIFTSPNPADWSSSRKGPPSLAPAIQANQLSSLFLAGNQGRFLRMSSAM